MRPPLTEPELARIEAAIRDAERGTSAEIVVVVAADHHRPDLALWPALVALACLCRSCSPGRASRPCALYAIQLGVLALGLLLLLVPAMRQALTPRDRPPRPRARPCPRPVRRARPAPHRRPSRRPALRLAPRPLCGDHQRRRRRGPAARRSVAPLPRRAAGRGPRRPSRRRHRGRPRPNERDAAGAATGRPWRQDEVPNKPVVL